MSKRQSAISLAMGLTRMYKDAMKSTSWGIRTYTYYHYSKTFYFTNPDQILSLAKKVIASQKLSVSV